MRVLTPLTLNWGRQLMARRKDRPGPLDPRSQLILRAIMEE